MEGRRLLLPHDQLMNLNDHQAAESQSGGGDGGVSDEEGHQNPRRGYHRHSAEQIQELESFFKECPHPDDRQRMELGRRLGLGARKIKFWFQNRRTQLKTLRERNQNILLREDNARLKSENDALKFRLTNPTCGKCNGPAFPDAAIGLSFEEKRLIRENAWLKDELARLQSLAEKVMANHVDISHSLLQLSCPTSNGDAENRYEALEAGDRAVSTGLSLGNETSMSPSVKDEWPNEKAGYIGVAISAMNELMKLSEAYGPIWTPIFDGPTELLGREDYEKMFPTATCLGKSPGTVVREGTRDSATVMLRSQAIVEILMDADKWLKAFPCLIANASTTQVISDVDIGSKDGSLQLMKAEFQVLSPLVSTCQVRFIRFCKRQREGLWAIVDVSVEDSPGSRALTYCRRLPSGCILQDLPNNCTKVTWIEHFEYDTSSIHPLFCLAINYGVLFGAPRWLASLQRHCESRNTKLSGTNPRGRQNVLKLAQHMNELFCSGICPALRSENICVGNIGEDVKIKHRRGISRPGEPPGLVLCVSTSFWMPATWDVLFDFLRNERARSQWDILSLTRDMQEIVRVPKGPGHNDCISLLHVTGVDSSQTRMMVVQESWIDSSGALIVYAPLETWIVVDAVRGMDTDTEGIDLLPSGFSIIPVGPLRGKGEGRTPGGGSLVTLGFQVLVDDKASAKLTPESFDTVSNLVSITINKIKVAMMGLTSA